MTDELARICERVRQSRTAREAEMSTLSAPGMTGTASLTGTVVVGDRIFDVETGQLGTVTGAGLADRLARGDVRVSLDAGASVIRSAAAVMRRPAA